MTTKQAFIQAEIVKNQWGNMEIRETRIHIAGPDPLPVRVDGHDTCINSERNRGKLLEAGYLIHGRI